MSERVIALFDQRVAALQASIPAHPIAAQGLLSDRLGRPLRDLRISVTDRCNFRCAYCMPKEVFHKDYAYLPHSDLLSFEEIARAARLFIDHGVTKLRLTGGEPLLRKNIEVLIDMLAQLKTPDGQALDITLTSNGSLLKKKAQVLKGAGLQRLTVSLDALDEAVFCRMNDVDFSVRSVLEGIEAAQAAGFENIKINMVVQRGTNDQEILPMARYFRASGATLRFIEYMDVGATNGWRMDQVLPSAQVLDRIQSEFSLVQLPPRAAGETAQRWGYADAHAQHDPRQGEIGFISSVTQAFCGDCNRARLSTDGKLYLCLFASQGYDLRTLLRSGASDSEIQSAIAQIWLQRTERYSQLRAELPRETSARARKVEMSYIGG